MKKMFGLVPAAAAGSYTPNFKVNSNSLSLSLSLSLSFIEETYQNTAFYPRGSFQGIDLPGARVIGFGRIAALPPLLTRLFLEKCRRTRNMNVSCRGDPVFLFPR
jgi:hypothetical protein